MIIDEMVSRFKNGSVSLITEKTFVPISGMQDTYIHLLSGYDKWKPIIMEAQFQAFSGREMRTEFDDNTEQRQGLNYAIGLFKAGKPNQNQG